jgi:hypothetical protein
VTAATAAAHDTTLLINNAGVLTATSPLTGDLPDISAEFGTNFYGHTGHGPGLCRAHRGQRRRLDQQRSEHVESASRTGPVHYSTAAVGGVSVI